MLHQVAIRLDVLLALSVGISLVERPQDGRGESPQCVLRDVVHRPFLEALGGDIIRLSRRHDDGRGLAPFLTKNFQNIDGCASLQVEV